MPFPATSSISTFPARGPGSNRGHPLVFIIAGEASGDLHASSIIRALRSIDSSLGVTGIGGPRMEEAGMAPLFPSSDMAVVGLVEVIRHLVPILRAYRRTVEFLRRGRPDLLILVDYPEFNMRMARKAKSLGIPVFYYITPQVWAWRQGRVELLRKTVDKMAVILPFEEAFFKARGLDATFVGHPLLDVVKRTEPPETVRSRLGVHEGMALVGILPGSRSSEVRRLLPLMLDTAEHLSARRPGTRFVLPLAPSIKPGMLPARRLRELDVQVEAGNTYDVMGACDALLMASGTVALEAAILGIPMVVTYKVSPITYAAGRCLVKVPHVSLVNLVAGREVVPEILQKEARPEVLSDAISRLMDPHRGREVRAELKQVAGALGTPGAAQRAARLAIECMRMASPRTA